MQEEQINRIVGWIRHSDKKRKSSKLALGEALRIGKVHTYFDMNKKINLSS
jgi:hypothetical protein